MQQTFRPGDPVLAQGVEGPWAGCADYVAPVVENGKLKHLVRFGGQGVGLAETVYPDETQLQPGQLAAVRNGDCDPWELQIWRGMPMPEQRNRGFRALAEPPDGSGEVREWRQCVPAQKIWPDMNLGNGNRPLATERTPECFRMGDPVAVRTSPDSPWRIAFYLQSLGPGWHSVESLPGSGWPETVKECRPLDEACPGLAVVSPGIAARRRAAGETRR